MSLLGDLEALIKKHKPNDISTEILDLFECLFEHDFTGNVMDAVVVLPRKWEKLMLKWHHLFLAKEVNNVMYTNVTTPYGDVRYLIFANIDKPEIYKQGD